jgi:hypothetical protein
MASTLVISAALIDAHRFVGKAHMERIAVRLGINRHGRYTQLFAGADDPQGDFPSIGD